MSSSESNNERSGDLFQKIRSVFQHSNQPKIIEKTFLHEVEVLLSGASSYISSSDIQPVSNLPQLQDLSSYREQGEQALSKLLVCKLNGGLGTSMGLESAKSLIAVKEHYSFLDIIIQQLVATRTQCHSPLPFICMNSFRTEADTLKVLPSDFNKDSHLPLSMLQHRVPKLDATTLEPVSYTKNKDLEWCPPGHGDIYPVLVSRGILEAALQKGFRYLFVSNADNLGATLSLELLGYLTAEDVPFLMEVTERTTVDRKGGHLAQVVTGQLLLRERAQVAVGDEGDFQDYTKYTSFNTNSLWIDLRALQALMEEHGGILPLPVMKNEKRVNPRIANSPMVYQLETAMGSVVSLFSGARAVVVPRSRFLPVKTTDDLLRVRSDVFTLSDSFELSASKDRLAMPITLDPRFYGCLDDFEERFSEGVPSLQAAESFVVHGNVRFGADVVCKGVVEVVGDDTEISHVPSGSVLSGRVDLREA